MSEPTAVALAEMGLLSRASTIQTTIVGIGDHVRRRAILDKFINKHKDDPMMCNVMWSADNNLAIAPSRCNGNLVLLEMGARVSQSGAQQAIDIPNIYILPRKALGEWSQKYLKVAHSHYKGHDRVLITEPAKCKIPRFFDYVPKLVYDSVDEEITKFVEANAPDNPGLTSDHVTVRFILMRCNLGLGHRGDVEDLCWVRNEHPSFVWVENGYFLSKRG